MLPVWLRGVADCTTAITRLMKLPVPRPTTAMTIIGTQRGNPTGSSDMTKSPMAPSAVPMIG